jgi:hypothetical protein
MLVIPARIPFINSLYLSVVGFAVSSSSQSCLTRSSREAIFANSFMPPVQPACPRGRRSLRGSRRAWRGPLASPGSRAESDSPFSAFLEKPFVRRVKRRMDIRIVKALQVEWFSRMRRK